MLARDQQISVSTGRTLLKPNAVWSDMFIMMLVAPLLSLVVFSTELHSQSSPYTPYQHKALYLFNFAKYTEWPKEAFADDNAPFVLGILGQDPFKSDIDIIKGKTVKGRKLVVRKFGSIQEVTGCHLLFICSSETNNLGQILQAVEHSSILTIAEADGFL